MLLLGLLLLGATGAFTGLLIAYNSAGGPEYTVAMFGKDLGTLNSLEVFLAGIALTLVFFLSLIMMTGGLSLQRRRRVNRRAERRGAAQARAERDAMAARLGPDDALADDSSVTVPENASATSARRRRRMPHVFGH